MNALQVHERPTRAILVEDDHLVRAAFRLLLERTHGMVVADAEDAIAARRLFRESMDVDLAMIDVHLPGEDGISLLRWVRGSRPALPCIVLSGRSSDTWAREALALGARAYLVKGATPAQLAEAIAVALSGDGTYIHPSVAASLFPAGTGAATPLTFREHMILSRVASGATNDQIAAALAVSLKTVKGDLASIYRKLGVANRTEAASRAVRMDLL